jgi:single-stranded DNA-binding protein
MNKVFVVGNVTSDICFDRFLMQGEKRSYLRLILMAERPRSVPGLRIVICDEKAELYFPYLKKGSELAVIGQFESLKYKNQWIHEVVSESCSCCETLTGSAGKASDNSTTCPVRMVRVTMSSSWEKCWRVSN